MLTIVMAAIGCCLVSASLWSVLHWRVVGVGGIVVACVLLFLSLVVLPCVRRGENVPLVGFSVGAWIAALDLLVCFVLIDLSFDDTILVGLFVVCAPFFIAGVAGVTIAVCYQADILERVAVAGDDCSMWKRERNEIVHAARRGVFVSALFFLGSISLAAIAISAWPKYASVGWKQDVVESGCIVAPRHNGRHLWNAFDVPSACHNASLELERNNSFGLSIERDHSNADRFLLVGNAIHFNGREVFVVSAQLICNLPLGWPVIDASFLVVSAGCSNPLPPPAMSTAMWASSQFLVVFGCALALSTVAIVGGVIAIVNRRRFYRNVPALATSVRAGEALD
jgi:hypothetical protein